MKIKKLWTLLVLAIGCLSTFAQENDPRFGFEFNIGPSIALTKPGDADVNPGFGFETLLHYRMTPSVGVYGGWGWNRFGADNSFAGSDVCFEETGYVLGLQWNQPVVKEFLTCYLRAGVLMNHIEIENADGDIIGDSGHGPGFQVAAGVNWSLGGKWSLTPGLKLNALSREVDMDGVTTRLDYYYLSFRVGILKVF